MRIRSNVRQILLILGVLTYVGLAATAGHAAVIPHSATVDGKYSNLLRIVNAPQDAETYGDFYEWGYWAGTEWAGQKNLPPGYWVYVKPNWYIWGERK